MIKKITLLFLASFILLSCLNAQDVIYKKGGEKIKCKVTQVSPDDVTYKLFEEVDGPSYTIDKQKILKILFQSGKVETYVSNAAMNDPELYVDQLKKAIKLNFLSPQIGYFEISYEKNIKPGTSYEINLAVIGGGRNVDIGYYNEGGISATAKRGAFGVAIGGGYKFNKMPNYITKGTRYAHIMQGIYVKPIATLGVYKENYLKYTSGLSGNTLNQRTIVYGALGLDLGKQWVFGEKFLLDIFWNLGYMVDSKNGNDVDQYIANNFTGTRFGNGAGIAFGGGLKVGILLK